MPAIPESEYAFDKDLTVKLHDLTKPAEVGIAKWRFSQIVLLVLMVAVLGWMLTGLPNRFLQPDVMHISIVLGSLGIWRFSWWFTHAVRAEIYRKLVWPKMRKNASQLWADGWRPGRLHIQMTTYFEEPAITKRVIGSILGQIRAEGVPTTLYVGTGSSYDEMIIRSFVETHAADIPDDMAELVFIRQNQPGKRMAIGLICPARLAASTSPSTMHTGSQAHEFWPSHS